MKYEVRPITLLLSVTREIALAGYVASFPVMGGNCCGFKELTFQFESVQCAEGTSWRCTFEGGTLDRPDSRIGDEATLAWASYESIGKLGVIYKSCPELLIAKLARELMGLHQIWVRDFLHAPPLREITTSIQWYDEWDSRFEEQETPDLDVYSKDVRWLK